jgi:hypothetical protein
MRLPAALAGPIVTAGLLLSACGGNSGGINLELAFPNDSTLEYRLTGSLTSAIDPGSGVPSQETTVEKTAMIELQGRGRDQKGATTVRRTLSKLEFRVGQGRPQTQPVTPSDVTFGSDGKVLSSEMLSPLSPDPTIGLLLPLLPDRAVHIGDSWETDYDVAVPYGSGKQHIHASNTLSRLVNQVAIVDSTVTMDIDAQIDVREQAARNYERLNIPDEYSPTQHVQITLSGTQTSNVDTVHKRLLTAKNSLDVEARYENFGFPPNIASKQRILGRIANEATLANP